MRRVTKTKTSKMKQQNKEVIIKILSDEKHNHTCIFNIIKGSGKETGIPKWKCMCGKIVESN